jgi:hypothetical protein
VRPHQYKYSDIFRYTTEELYSVTTQYATSSKAAKFCLPHGSMQVTPSNDREALSDVAVQSASEGTKRWRKQRLQGAMTTADYNDDNNGKVGGSGKGPVMTVVHNDKHQARSPTNHFKRLLEEACPKHAYHIRHKLKDYDMMKSFMISGSPTQGTELDEDPSGSETMPFPDENEVMMVYDGCPPPGRRRVSKLGLRPLTHCVWGHGGTGV